MEYILEFEEAFGFENVKEMREMKDLTIYNLPCMDKDTVEDVDFFREFFTEEANMNLEKYDDATLILYTEEKLKDYMKNLLRTYAWDNYKICFCLEWYEYEEEGVYLLKYGNYCFDFNSNYSYKITKKGLIKYKNINECLEELGIEEDDIHQLYVLVPNQERKISIRRSIRRFKDKAKLMGPKNFEDMVMKKMLIDCIPNYNESNDYFFEDVEFDEIEKFLIENSSNEDIENFYKKYIEDENAVIC